MEKKNWIQKAVNKEHKGYCTPMTKPTCTPKRKNLAKTFKENAKKWKHEKGGKVENTFGKDQPFPKINKVAEKKQKGGNVTATADSTKFYQKQVAENMANHFKAQGKDAKEEASKKATQSKNSLNRQANKGKPGFDKNGFPLVKKQNGGEMPKGGDQAAVYKKGKKINKKQVGGPMGSGAAAYGLAKKVQN